MRPRLSLVPLALAGMLAACAASDHQDRGGDGYGRGGDLGGLLGGILGGRGSYGGDRYGSERISYRCDDDRRLTVTYDRAGDVTVDTENGSYDLRAEGRDQYSSRDGDIQLEADRDRAYLRIKGQNDYKDCRAR